MAANGTQQRQRQGMGMKMADTGSPEQLLVWVVIAELVVLIFIRRAFKAAHGG